MWPAGIVGRVRLLSDPLVPVIAITIERSCPMAVDADIITADYQGSRLVLVPDIHGVIEPVLDISAPLIETICQRSRRFKSYQPPGKKYQKCAIDINVNILEPVNVHDRVDVVIGRLENDPPFMTTLLERLQNCRRIVSRIAATALDHAALSVILVLVIGSY